MHPVDDMPVFGSRVEGCPYIVRPSAYALVANESGKLAVVRTVRGYFLPGGGIESNESPEQTIEREAREECGLRLRSRRVLGKAVDIVYSQDEHACFEKRSTFIVADLIGVTPPEDQGHELVWLDPVQMVEMLSHAGHRWAAARSVL